MSLYGCLRKITLVDFWASWCAPCRIENPENVRLYNLFKSKGFTIIGVSLDDDLNKWKAAIEKDKLTWLHVSNLKQWEDPIAVRYSVTQIPFTLLLDETGTIIAKDIHGKALEEMLNSLLK